MSFQVTTNGINRGVGMVTLAIGLGMLVVGGYWIHRLHLDELVFRRAAAEGQGLQRLWKARA